MPKQKAFKKVYETILKKLNQNESFVVEFGYYRTIDYHSWEDNDFFETISEVIFYSNLPRETVNHKLPAIKEAFSNFDIDKVAAYTKKDIKRLQDTPEIIHNMDRIKATVKNAQEFQQIIREYGSFCRSLVKVG